MAKEVSDAITMKRALTRMTYEIIRKNKGVEQDRFSRDQGPVVFICQTDRSTLATTRGCNDPGRRIRYFLIS